MNAESPSPSPLDCAYCQLLLGSISRAVAVMEDAIIASDDLSVESAYLLVERRATDLIDYMAQVRQVFTTAQMELSA